MTKLLKNEFQDFGISVCKDKVVNIYTTLRQTVKGPLKVFVNGKRPRYLLDCALGGDDLFSVQVQRGFDFVPQ